MRATPRTFAAMRLGIATHKLAFAAHHRDWPALRDEMAGAFAELDLVQPLPDTVEGWTAAQDEIESAIVEHLASLRARIGGDCYALPMYWLAWLSLRLPLLAALGDGDGGATRAALVTSYRGLLGEFSIDADEPALAAFVETESRWLVGRAAAHDGEIPVLDGARAGYRLLSRALSLWERAERLVDLPVDFVRAPFQSVFISYSTADEAFAAELHEALTTAGVRAWFAPHDMKPGAKIHEQLREAIDTHDRLLLVVSEASMRSDWVNTELWRARQRERATGRRLLFPVRLVPWDRVQAWEAFDADSGRDLAREVREYFVPDFSGWRDEAAFGEQVRRLVDALVAEAPAPAADA